MNIYKKMWGTQMIKIKRTISILLCAIFLFNSSITGMAKETVLHKAFITVGLSNGTTQMYRVLLKGGELYVSAKDLSKITGYKYVEDGCIAFKKNDYNLMEEVFIDFSGDAEVSQKKYKLDIIKRKNIYYLPLEKTLYLLRANWCVENDILYINPMDSDILDFMYLYWDEIEKSKLRTEDLFINKEYSESNNLTDSFWNSLAHMTRDFDNRLYIPGGSVDMINEEYEKALMQLNEDDQQFLGEEGQKNIEEQLKKSELDTIKTKEGVLEKFVEIPEKAESLTKFLDNYEKENTVARKISNVIKKSEIQSYKMTDLSEMCGKFSDAMTIMNAVLNVMEISSWAAQMDEEFLNQLSIIEDINDKKIYSGWALKRMKDAAQDLRKRKENKSETVVYDSWKETIKTLTGALADLTCTGKLVSAIQMIDSINSLTESGLNRIIKAKELNYTIRYFLNLEQLAEIESVKQYGIIFVDKKLNAQTIQKMRSLLLMRLRLDLRARSMLYKLNQMERSDREVWEKSSEAQDMLKRIEKDYSLIIELQSTEKSDKRLPQDSLKNIYCNEDGLTKEKIQATILKKNFKGKQEEQAENVSEIFSIYQNACRELISKGNWKEELYAQMKVQLEGEGEKQKTEGSMYSDINISGYQANDLSNMQLDGSFSYEMATQFYDMTLQYSNGNYHVEQTSPTENTYDMQIDPEEINKFDYITISEAKVRNVEESRDRISFTVPGDVLNEKGSEISTLMPNMTDISYSDMDVVAEIDEEENRLYNVNMIFSMKCTYQGYKAFIDYNVNYSLSQGQ